MNFAYQLSKHLACHMERWPHRDRAEVEKTIAQHLKSGQAWLWPEPMQGELFA